MVTDLKVLAVVSARAGSKGVPGKNLRPLGGRPLIGHVLSALRAARRIGRIVLSTEDPAIAAVARDYGAETPFVRPPELAEDMVPLVAVTKHGMEQMDALGYRADIVVQISPTCPFLAPESVDRAVALVAEGADSAVTLKRIEHEHPYRAKVLAADGTFSPFLTDRDVERFQSRQELPELYCTSGAIYARRRELLEQWSGRDFGFGRVSKGVVLDDIQSVNIDRPVDFLFAEFLVASGTAKVVQ
jgi:CMP-N,N'-diacetyllegionaminic acid synthase